MQRQRGLTLLELLVVMAIIGMALVGVSLSLRDSHQTQLEREAQRLVAMLESARAQSRTSGIALVWHVTPNGFVIQPSQGQNAIAARTETWLAAGTQAIVGTHKPALNDAPALNEVVLGPEPLLLPTRITLSITPTSGGVTPTLSIGTDGLKPFQVLP